jgi:hypothetical protein
MSVGVKQGGKASPYSLPYRNFYVNPLIRALAESKLIFKIKDVPVSVVVYADDSTLLCGSRKNANEALKLFGRL